MTLRGKLIIRAVNSGDCEALRAIYNWAVTQTTATMDLQERTVEKQRAWITSHDGDPYPALAAVDAASGAVVGYASLSAFDYMPGYCRTVENSLYVHPDWQGQGIGALLLTELIAQARQSDFTTVVALISADNDVSLRLHRRLGFADAGLLRRVGWKHGREIDVAYLQLFLRRSPETPSPPTARG